MKCSKQGWEFQEAGWWTHERFGGICKERKGWACYPINSFSEFPSHMARNRLAAMTWIENNQVPRKNKG